MTARSPHVIVIGVGFSGLLTAIHLLRSASDIRVTLVERRSALGPGTAYDTGNADHLLNVRLGNMSAFPDEPAHLSEWLAQQPSWEASGEFITRGTYGAYLRDLLDSAVADNPGRLDLVPGRAETLDRADGVWLVGLADGRALKGDVVVLAIGNQEPSTPPGVDEALRRSALYVENPGRRSAGPGPGATGAVDRHRADGGRRGHRVGQAGPDHHRPVPSRSAAPRPRHGGRAGR